MKRATQGTNKDKPADGRNVGLPVAKDATQRNEPRRTPESRGDRDDHLGGSNQNRERQMPNRAR
jgi:hypothetical protein